MALENNSAGKNKKKRFKIEDLPESSRKLIFKITITVLGLIIIIFWFISVGNSISLITNEPTNKNWEEIKQDIGGFFQKSKEGLSEVKEKINQLTEEGANLYSTTTLDSLILDEPTTSSEISENELEKLKEKIKELDIQ